MKLWILERKGGGYHGQLDDVVVRAETEEQARQLAKSTSGFDGSEWMNEDKTTCKVLTQEGNSEVIAFFVV